MKRNIAIYTYLTLLVLATVLPINGTESALNNNYTLNIRWDYLLHALAYIPIPVLLKYLVKPYWQIIAASLLIAAALEAFQLLLPDRAFNANDLLANIIGVVMGIILVVIIRVSSKRQSI